MSLISTDKPPLFDFSIGRKQPWIELRATYQHPKEQPITRWRPLRDSGIPIFWDNRAWAWGLPSAEALIGLLLVLGWQTRQALIASGLVMETLISGMALRSDWPTLGIQMVYSASYFLLLRDASHNGFSSDG